MVSLLVLLVAVGTWVASVIRGEPGLQAVPLLFIILVAIAYVMIV